MSSKFSKMFFFILIVVLVLSSGTTSQKTLQENSLNIALIDVSKVLEFRYKQDMGINPENKDFRSIRRLFSTLQTQPVNALPICKEVFRQALILYELQLVSECSVPTQDTHHHSCRWDVYDFAVCAYLERQAHYLKEVKSIFQSANEENSQLAKTFGYQIIFSKQAANRGNFVFTCGQNPWLEPTYDFTDIKCSNLVSSMSGENLLMLKAPLNLVVHASDIDITEKVIAHFKTQLPLDSIVP